MIYRLYGDKIIGLSTDTSEMCHMIETSGYWFWREAIRGYSGIADFGAHIGPIDDHTRHQVLTKGVIWSKDKIRRRSRYSSRDGGKMFDSFRKRYNNFKIDIKNKINDIFNLK